MQMMQEDGPRFAEIEQIERRLRSLTYSSRPFTNLQTARNIAEDLQRLRDLYGMGNGFGRAYRTIGRTVRSWFTRSPAAAQ